MLGILKNSIANLKGHKLRIVVAFIWIIVGITSVIFVTSLGNAMKKQISKTFENINPNQATVLFKPDSQDYDISVIYSAFRLSDKQELELIDGVKSVKAKSQFWTDYSDDRISLDSSYGNNTSNLYIGVQNGDKDKVKLTKGKGFDSVTQGLNTIIITTDAEKELMKTYKGSIVGRAITINGRNFEVIGVIDQNYVYDEDEHKFVKATPYNTDLPTSYISKAGFKGLNANSSTNEVGSFVLSVEEGYSPKEVGDEAVAKMSELHPDVVGHYEIEDLTTVTKQLQEITGGIDKFVKIITIVAMAIGGIGIMNIMYVSVMERHREIGIRRALGAKKRDIILQFLIESVFITSCGGVLGIVIGLMVTYYTRNLMPFKPIISLSGIVYAVLTIVITGVVFGIVPASKAASLDPIEAIYK